MSIELEVAIIGLFGALAAAFIAWWVEREKVRRDRLAAVYTAHLEAYSKDSLLREFLHQRMQEGDAEGIRACQRELDAHQGALLKANSDVLVYGSRRVITALYNLHEAAVDDSYYERLVELHTQMRADSNASDYPGYSEHVDGIVGKKALERALQMSQPTGPVDAVT